MICSTKISSNRNERVWNWIIITRQQLQYIQLYSVDDSKNRILQVMFIIEESCCIIDPCILRHCIIIISPGDYCTLGPCRQRPVQRLCFEIESWNHQERKIRKSRKKGGQNGFEVYELPCQDFGQNEDS